MGLDSCRASARLLNSSDGDPQVGGQLLALLRPVGHELVQRGIEEAEGDGQAVHDVHGLLHVVLHEREHLLQGLAALGLGLGDDHAAQEEQRPVGALAVEHVLEPEEPDALGAELARLLRILRRVRVGAHAQRSEPCRTCS